MKKRSLFIVVLALVVVMSLALVACGGDKNNTEESLVAPKVDAITVDFARGITLESAKLPEGFAWKDAKTLVKVGENEYDAVYTKDGKSADAKVVVKANPTKTMLDEEVTMNYIENYLASADFDKDGVNYASVQYDQFVMILARSARGLKNDIKADYMARVKDVVLKEVDPTTNIAIVGEGWTAINYTVNTVITLIAMGENTTIDGVDLAAPYYDETFALINDIYTLDDYINIVKNIAIPATYKTKDGEEHTSTNTLKKMTDKMLLLQIANGGWSYDAASETIDYDGTTAAIYALGDIKDADLQAKLDKAYNSIKNPVLGENGGLISWGSENRNSTATLMTALDVMGVDVANVKNAETGKSMLDFMTSCRLADGAYSMDGETANGLLTKDAAIALVNYNRNLRGEGNFYSINIK